jgi:hypothetical protein
MYLKLLRSYKFYSFVLNDLLLTQLVHNLERFHWGYLEAVKNDILPIALP